MMWKDVDIIRVAANNINFEVATLGDGDRLALCLHGFPEHAYSWRHQMPVLAHLGYRVWAPNLRGYGNTDSPQEIAAYRIAILLEDVVGLIRASGARQVLLIGHDWGGALAWTLAMQHPGLINRLVVLNIPHPACFLREIRRPAQFAKSWYVLLFQLPAIPERLLGLGQGRLIAQCIRRSSHNPLHFPDHVLEVYRQNAARPNGLTAMLNWYRALFRGGRSGWRDACFRKIEIPTLMLWGDADVALSIRTTRGTQDYVSDLTFRILPGVSHWIQQEAPEAVNAMLEAWLSGVGVPEFADLPPRSSVC